MNAPQQEMPQTEALPREASSRDASSREASQRRRLQQQLVEAQDAYWSHVTHLSALVGRIQGFGQRLVDVESLRVEDVLVLPEKSDLIAAMEQTARWAQEIARLNTLLGA